MTPSNKLVVINKLQTLLSFSLLVNGGARSSIQAKRRARTKIRHQLVQRFIVVVYHLTSLRLSLSLTPAKGCPDIVLGFTQIQACSPNESCSFLQISVQISTLQSTVVGADAWNRQSRWSLVLVLWRIMTSACGDLRVSVYLRAWGSFAPLDSVRVWKRACGRALPNIRVLEFVEERRMSRGSKSPN